MTDLANLLPDLVVVFRLRWYYCEAEGALGLRSGFGDQLERARAAGGRNRGSKPLGAAQAVEVTDHQLEAAAAVREIEDRLRLLPRSLRATLEAAFGPGLPAVARRDLSWLGTSTVPASVVLLMAARRRLTRKSLDKMRRDSRPEEKARLESLRLAARIALTQAVLAYQDTRRDRRPRPSKEAR